MPVNNNSNSDSFSSQEDKSSADIFALNNDDDDRGVTLPLSKSFRNINDNLTFNFIISGDIDNLKSVIDNKLNLSINNIDVNFNKLDSVKIGELDKYLTSIEYNNVPAMSFDDYNSLSLLDFINTIDSNNNDPIVLQDEGKLDKEGEEEDEDEKDKDIPKVKEKVCGQWSTPPQPEKPQLIADKLCSTLENGNVLSDSACGVVLGGWWKSCKILKIGKGPVDVEKDFKCPYVSTDKSCGLISNNMTLSDKACGLKSVTDKKLTQHADKDCGTLRADPSTERGYGFNHDNTCGIRTESGDVADDLCKNRDGFVGQVSVLLLQEAQNDRYETDKGCGHGSPAWGNNRYYSDGSCGKWTDGGGQGINQDMDCGKLREGISNETSWTDETCGVKVGEGDESSGRLKDKCCGTSATINPVQSTGPAASRNTPWTDRPNDPVKPKGTCKVNCYQTPRGQASYNDTSV